MKVPWVRISDEIYCNLYSPINERKWFILIEQKIGHVAWTASISVSFLFLCLSIYLFKLFVNLVHPYYVQNDVVFDNVVI